MLDGYPRTLEQAEYLQQLLQAAPTPDPATPTAGQCPWTVGQMDKKIVPWGGTNTLRVGKTGGFPSYPLMQEVP